MFYIIKHVPEEGPGYFETFLPKDTLVIMADSCNFPEVTEKDSVLIMGGPMGVYEKSEYAFITKELDFIKKCYDRNVKVIGICLGAQMIAEALGGNVYRGHKKEIGWYEIEHTSFYKNDKLFSHFPEKIVVFQWHQDTFELPPHAVRLARSSEYENQAFKVGDRIYGLQYHIEVTEELLKEWFLSPDEQKLFIDTSKINFLKPYTEAFFKKFLVI